MLRRSLFTALLALALVFGLVWLKGVLAPAEVGAPPPSAAGHAAPVRVLVGEEVREMPLEEYLIGVVAAEMPADFEPEALKAQAVAARTYTLYCARTGKHADADVCTDPACCQAWRSGAADDAGLSSVADAVESTAGELLCFAGEAAFTAFHSSSAGFTEDCGAIWSGLPYLVSVSSPEGDDSVPNYVSTARFSPLDLRDTLLAVCPEADFTGPPETWPGECVRDGSGRVAALTLGGAVFSGVKLRALFSLRSTAFTLDYREGEFVFTVTGFGHGVGMSQYGANVMAARGADYRAILAHYYPGTELTSL